MKTKLNLFQTGLLGVVALGGGACFSLAAAPVDATDTAPAKASIPWSQIGAKAGADYKGDGLTLCSDRRYQNTVGAVFQAPDSLAQWLRLPQ